jgi:glucose/arabinose dehydrogenase
VQRAFVPNLGAVSTSELTSGLASPWCLAFLPDGRMLVTRKAGQLRLLSASGLPAVGGVGQGGLPDAVNDRAFARNRRICFSFSEANAGRAALNGTAVARFELDAAALRLVNLSVICRPRLKIRSSVLWGYRLVFDVHREGGHERLRVSLSQRTRDVREGQDGQLCLLTDDPSNG